MALQGTIDAFPLVDVVQLLGVSHKTGRLTVEGDRGTGRIWVVDGALAAADHRGERATDATVALFELLRPASGSFVFDPDVGPEVEELEPVPLLELLDRAAELLEEWRTVQAVVPSGAHRPVLEAEPAADEVVLDRDRWRLVVAVADAPSVAALGAALELDELATGRALAGLVAEGLVRIEEPTDPVVDVAGVDPSATAEPPQDEVVDPVELLGEPTDPEPFPEHFPIDDLVVADSDPEDPWTAFEPEEDRFAAAQAFADPEAPVVLPPVGDAGWDQAFTPDPAAFEPSPPPAAPFPDAAFADEAFAGPAFADEAPAATAAPAVEGGGDAAFRDPAANAWEQTVPAAEPGDPAAADVDGTDEILRQMSRLSPKAAEAIAAALGTATDDDDGDGFLRGE